jgi:hypothetical protein
VRSLPLAVLVALWSAGAVQAQTAGRVAIGANVSSKGGVDPRASGHTNPGFLFRVGHGKPGWGWKYGFNWYATDLEQRLDGSDRAFGELKVRPLMGGYGYTHLVGSVQVSANLLGGFAFTSFELQPSFDESYRQMLGVTSVRTHTSNALVTKPEISAWINMSRKIGLNINAGYLVARPTVTVSTTAGDDRQHVRADMFILKVGAVYTVF